jgi:hypothetical protein
MTGQPMTPAEKGRRGGNTTKARQAADYYSRIGRQGGAKGGNTTKARYGRDHYRRIALLSVAARRRKRDREQRQAGGSA